MLVQLLPINQWVLFKLLMITACLGFLYAPVMKGLIYDWMNLPDFSHGFFIPLISLYLIYERRKQLSTLTISGCWAGVGLVIFGVLLLLLGNLATEYSTMRFSMIVVFGGLIVFHLGKEYIRILLFPLIFLIFMIPLPSILMGQITFPMQIFASKVSAKSLCLIGVPALREGNIIQLANTSLEVAEACSGIRSLISLVALAVVFAYFSQKTTFKRILLVISAFPIAVVANAARVTGTGILAHHYGDSVAQGFFHGLSGWILFVATLICLFVIGSLLSRIKSSS